jgi:hypothetical protein
MSIKLLVIISVGYVVIDLLWFRCQHDIPFVYSGCFMFTVLFPF